MLNYKINNHGKNETKHDYLIFITAKEKSYTAKTGAPGPKQLICLKNKLLTEKVVVSSFWSKAIQVRGASLCNNYVHDIDFHISFCLYYLLLFLPPQGFAPEAKTRRRHPRIPCVYTYKEFQNV